MEHKICRIVGAGDFCADNFSHCEGDLILAADGGLAYLSALGISPDYCIGDFDSLGYAPEQAAAKYPCEKDDTDMMLTVDYGFSKGCDTFYLYGALGGRESHTLANIQVLRHIVRRGGRGFLIGNKQMITVIENSTIALAPKGAGYLSVLCLGDRAEGVTIQGLKYCVENITMLPDRPLGVSNEFIGQSAHIGVEHGALVIIWEDTGAATVGG